jgi:hypothetical protein
MNHATDASSKLAASIQIWFIQLVCGREVKRGLDVIRGSERVVRGKHLNLAHRARLLWILDEV